MATIAFIGLGNMGSPMALNLLQAGYDLRVFDVVSKVQESAVDAGAKACGNAADAVAGADIVISMLPASRQVEGLYLGQDTGLLACVAADTMLIDCSTIDPPTSIKVHTAAKQKGLAMLDAPVSGGTAGAAAGTLTFMVGGDESLFARCGEVFQAMGSHCFHAGGAGAGQVAKICNNMLLAISMSGTAEALHLGVANGLDPAVLSEIISQSSGGNWPLSVYNPYPGVMPDAPAGNDYKGGFAVDLMLKDLTLAMAAGASVDSPTPMGSLARSLYMMLKQQLGTGGKDFSSIQKLYSDKS